MHPPPAPTGSPDATPQNPHYINAVTEMGEQCEVLAQEDIYAANGMKLLARGARINKSQCERLNLHKLCAPLDMVLSTERPVDAAHLASEAGRLLADEPVIARLVERSGDPFGFRPALGALSLSTPLAFRLTVMRERRASLFAHSLRTALVSYALAVRLGLPERQRQELLLAAICHDLGEMHTDPDLLAPGHRITPQERRFVHVHPITSYVLLRDLDAAPPAVLQAVLHHHERLDGSGYPYGLGGEQIHPLANILCVAELMETVGRRADLQRLDVLLRLNRHRLDPAAAGALHELLRADAARTHPEPANADAMLKLSHLGDVLHAWDALRGRLEEQAAASGRLEFLAERMARLRSLLLQAGIDPQDAKTLLEIAREEDSVLNELQATLDELRWLMNDIANEIERRTLALDDQNRHMVDEFTGLLRRDPSPAAPAEAAAAA
ncbi:HD-GYP domain-containing protein [Noviherbaspirillum massiliense]|uniref:HD-GYP domain-containing protein n=1 Tax=Noviherbaspirillum massiliense TaxID=1465823 RepID=UPI00031B1970|nr:HD domain-containing phosphohydrolase [Noviherbaspirillum massiliense]